ncbi:DUF6634 family protein [Microvirga sp. Mcv34]|uniref:DUF6634 family protein n=1 Tax=Microvirga sp. Mcv34 TaxID=2926016 RepID=UPI0021CA1DED|nr:DUF6634 family protein [Microvirga sp. Mcv34]
MTPEDLADAPLLDDYYVLPHGDVAVLFGNVSGHPTLRGYITTSRVTAMDAEAGWAETLNRTYRLGSPYVKPRQTYLEELIATAPSVAPDIDIEAAKRAWEDDPSLPPWRP